MSSGRLATGVPAARYRVSRGWVLRRRDTSVESVKALRSHRDGEDDPLEKPTSGRGEDVFSSLGRRFTAEVYSRVQSAVGCGDLEEEEGLPLDAPMGTRCPRSLER